MKKHRLLSLLLCAGMVCGTLAGCADKEADDKSSQPASGESTAVTSQPAKDTVAVSGTINVLTNRTDLVDTVFTDYVQKFNEKYPDVTVKFEGITDYEQDVAIRMQTTEYGDVLCIPKSLSTTELSSFFEPLGTVQELSGKYDENFLNARASDGQVYGFASMANTCGVVYNKKVFSDAGITEIPKTPEEFIAAMQKIKDNTKAIPYYTNYAAGWPLSDMEAYAYGGMTGDADYHYNKIIFEKEPFSPGKPHYDLYKLIYDLVSKGLVESDPVTTDWEKSKVMLNNGEIGAMILGSWSVPQMQGAGSNAGDIGYMAFPYTIDGKQYASTSVDYCFGINKNSKNKEAARAWIDFMINESGYALSQGGISIVKTDPLPDALKDMSEVVFVADNPASAENEGIFDELNTESEVGLFGDTEKKRIVEAAMGSSSETYDDIMADWNQKWTRVQQELSLLK